MMMDGPIPNRQDMASLSLLVTWKIWNERNARVFRKKQAAPSVILEIIKKEARLWVITGAKRLDKIMPGESLATFFRFGLSCQTILLNQ
jgi:hypothetical protein